MIDSNPLPIRSDLYQTLESGVDGKPGGILITSVGQEVSPNIWLGGYKALETESFLKKNNITHILSIGHFKYIYKPDQFVHKVCKNLIIVEASCQLTQSIRLSPLQIIPKQTLYNIFLKQLNSLLKH